MRACVLCSCLAGYAAWCGLCLFRVHVLMWAWAFCVSVSVQGLDALRSVPRYDKEAVHHLAFSRLKNLMSVRVHVCARVCGPRSSVRPGATMCLCCNCVPELRHVSGMVSDITFVCAGGVGRVRLLAGRQESWCVNPCASLGLVGCVSCASALVSASAVCKCVPIGCVCASASLRLRLTRCGLRVCVHRRHP